MVYFYFIDVIHPFVTYIYESSNFSSSLYIYIFEISRLRYHAKNGFKREIKKNKKTSNGMYQRQNCFHIRLIIIFYRYKNKTKQNKPFLCTRITSAPSKSRSNSCTVYIYKTDIALDCSGKSRLYHWLQSFAIRLIVIIVYIENEKNYNKDFTHADALLLYSQIYRKYNEFSVCTSSHKKIFVQFDFFFLLLHFFIVITI